MAGRRSRAVWPAWLLAGCCSGAVAQSADTAACDAAEPFDPLGAPAAPLDARAAWLDTRRLLWSGSTTPGTPTLARRLKSTMR